MTQLRVDVLHVAFSSPHEALNTEPYTLPPENLKNKIFTAMPHILELQAETPHL